MPERPSGRRTFGPVVLAGLAGAGLSAVAGHRTWASAEGGGHAGQGLAQVAAGTGVGESPAAGALALVTLACWGVLLVTRGRVRRAVAGLAVLAAAAVLAAVVVGWSEVPGGVRDAVTALGVESPRVVRTGWIWATGAGAVVALAAGVGAVLLAPGWPEMGRRYDAPGTSPGDATPGAEPTSLDLWRAMDEGDDPTV